MAKIKLNGDTSGYIEISAPAVSGNNTLELGPGTKILTNLDNTFTGVSTFTSGLQVTGGNVAVGHNNPSVNLHVKGSASNGQIYLGGTGAHSQIYADNDGVLILNADQGNSAANSYLGFNVDNTERLRITSAGKVGINTASPRAVLDIEGNAENFTLFLHSNDANANLQFSDNSGGARILNYGGDLAFRTGTNAHSFGVGDNEALRITSTGNIGVGGATGTDYSLLDGIVTNTANGSAGLLINSSSSSHNAYMSFGYGSGSGTSHADQFSAYIGRVGDDTLILGTNNNIRLRIGSDGHLSYKNSSPPAWSTDSGYANATLGSSAYFRTDTDVNSNFFTLGSNAYRGSSNWQHVNSGWATQLQQSAHTGDLYYSSSSTSGSADGTITWVEHFRATSAGNFGIGDVPSAGDGATYNNWDTPKLHVRGSSSSGKFHLLGRFRAGDDSDNTGAQIVIHHENDRGMALQGGRSASNRSYGAIKSLDNLAREATVMDFRGDNGQGVDYIKFYTGSSNPTTEQFKIDSSGRVYMPNQPRFFAWGNSSVNKSTTGYHTWETFNNTRFNVGNHFSTSTKLFTAPVSGTYLFGCNCRLDQGGTGYFRIILSINGSSGDNDQGHSIRNADAANASFHSQEITALYQLSANDNVRVIVEANTDSSWQMQSESQFWGYLVA